MKFLVFILVVFIFQNAYTSECTSIHYDNELLKIYERTESSLNILAQHLNEDSGDSVRVFESLSESLNVNKIELCYRSAVKQVRRAIENGQSFNMFLSDLMSYEPSQTLRDLSRNGVVTRDILLHQFSDVRRDVLRSHRTALLSEETNSFTDRVGIFLTRELDVRSVGPAEGNSPDAILSRVEALLTNNYLQRAFREVSQLDSFTFEKPEAYLLWLDSLSAHVEALNEMDEIEDGLQNL